MLSSLINKQLYELFKGWFYNAKTNKSLTKFGTLRKVILFLLLTVVLLGGIFGYLALSFCGALKEAGMDWLYFLIFSGIAILLGVFGSVFNTFSELYLAKDNDLLLSMPIPVEKIIFSRIFTVFIMAAFYSGLVYIPAIAVYQIVGGFDLAALIGGIISFLEISIIDLALSCLLGFAVAKISLKIKGKSYVKVITSLLFIAVYYFFYFKAQDLVKDLVTNSVNYGEKIKGSAAFLYAFGQNCCRIGPTTLLCVVVVGVFSLTVWFILSKTFLKIAISQGSGKIKVKKGKTEKAVSVAGALFKKELRRFTSSANYMLNCGLGVLIMPVASVILLIKAKSISAAVNDFPEIILSSLPVLLAGVSFFISSMIDTAVPSVSLEGKNLWILRSLPVPTFEVIKSKIKLQLLLSYFSMAFFDICTVIAMLLYFNVSVFDAVLYLVFSLCLPLFSEVYSMVIGLKMPNLTWTSEITPIKQSGGVAVSIFSDWGFAVLFAGAFFLLKIFMGVSSALYLAAATAVILLVTALLFRWLKVKGTVLFESL